MKKLTTFLVATLSATLLSTVGVSAKVIPLEDAVKLENNVFKLQKDLFEVKWSDEFDGTKLDRNKWNVQVGNGPVGLAGWGNNELEYYKDSTENLNVSDGTLKIIAKYANNQYTSGRINTSGKGEGSKIGKGYIEGRIKLPSLRGIWPAFWMLGTNGKTWPACGEIDIMETWNTDTMAAFTLHYADLNGNDNYGSGARVSKEADDVTPFDKTQWHTYGVYRDDQSLSYIVDGRLIGKCKMTKPEMDELYDDYYILLNMACGGNLTGNNAPAVNALPVTMEVDYVRYYVAKEGSSQNETKVTPTQQTTVADKKITVSKTAVKKLKNVKKRKLKVSLKKVKGAKGYVVRFCDNKKFDGYEDIKTKKTTVTIKGLDKKTKYYVKAKAYVVVNSKKYYSKWSSVKSKKIKK